MSRKRWKILIGILLCVCLLVVLWVYYISIPKYNIIVITLDTTRPDHLKCYGYDFIHTPGLDGLAKDGIRFENAFSSSPTTLPSHSTLFTGLYPIGHGVLDNSGHKLPNENIQTLAEALKARGYQTSAFIASRVLEKELGLGQGFDTYKQDIPINVHNLNAETVLGTAKTWLQENHEKTFFSWIHLYDPHQPYEAPSPYKNIYTDPYDAEIAYMDSELKKFVQYLKEKKLYKNTIIVVVGDHGEGLGEHKEQTHGYFVYDSTLKVPLIIKPALSQKELFQPVVKEQVRMIDIMPTILSLLNESTPQVFLTALNYEIPNSIQGNDLTPLMRGVPNFYQGKSNNQKYSYGETFLPFYKYKFCPLRSLRSSEYKYIQHIIVGQNLEEALAPQGKGKEELYNIKEDPKELNNIIEKSPEIAAEFRKYMAHLVTSWHLKRETKTKVSEQKSVILEALGYAGSVPELGGENLPDPKEFIDIHLLLSRARSEFRKNQLNLVQQRLDEIEKIKRKSNQRDQIELEYVTRLQGLVYWNSKNYQASKEKFEELIRENENDTTSRFYLAKCLFALNQKEKAQKEIAEVIEKSPHFRDARASQWSFWFYTQQYKVLEEAASANEKNFFALSWYWRGMIFEVQKNLKEAKKAYEKAIKDENNDPQSVSLAYIQLGKYYYQQKEHQKAIDNFLASLTFQGKQLEPLTYIASIYYQLNQQAKSISYWKQALEAFPSRWEIIQNLLIIYSDLNLPEESYKLILHCFQHVGDEFSEEQYWLLIQGLNQLKKPDFLQHLEKFVQRFPNSKEGKKLLQQLKSK